jgi:hypothetical protein
MVRYIVLEEKTGKELSQKLGDLSQNQPTSVQGFTYNHDTQQYACLVYFPSEQAVVEHLPLTSAEAKLISRNNVLVLREQGASKREISDYLAISKEEVDALLGKTKGKTK